MKLTKELLLQLLYPWRCPFCGEISKEQICGKCAPKLPYVEEPRCEKCGKPIRYMEKEYCHDCESKVHEYEAGRSVWLHKESVAASVYQFKYHNRRSYAKCYAQEMARLYSKQIKRWGIQIILPIPVSAERKRERGYNQAECLAKELGAVLRIPVEEKILIRVKRTLPQKKLDPKVRAKNLKGAFRVRKNLKNVGSILLVDDIYTTGSTIDEAAKTLKEAGVRQVYFMAISIGQGF